MNLTDQVANIRLQLQEAADAASQKINAGPDNPSIDRVSKKCFTISSSKLGSSLNLSPFFHDWRAQYEFIGDLVERGNFHDVSKIIENGSFRASGETRSSYTFAPEVVAHVKTIVGDLNLSATQENENVKPMRTPRFR